jgi:hypothetical protein
MRPSQYEPGRDGEGKCKVLDGLRGLPGSYSFPMLQYVWPHLLLTMHTQEKQNVFTCVIHKTNTEYSYQAFRAAVDVTQPGKFNVIIYNAYLTKVREANYYYYLMQLGFHPVTLVHTIQMVI